MRQTDRRDRETERETGGEKDRDEFCLMWSYMSSAQCRTYKAGWAMSFQAFIFLS